MPLWAIGLVLAGVAPFMVRAIADALDKRARKRTEAAIARAEKNKRVD